ncbi:biotin synthase [bacterium BD-1]|nr:biotin synthase [Ottowia caeni]
MSDLLPPSIDPIAAARWASKAAEAENAPWLHEEVARRMAERLQYIRLPVTAWADWEPDRGGKQGHALVAAHYPAAESFLVEARARQPTHPSQSADKPAALRWLARLSLGRSAQKSGTTPPEGAMQMVWANMLAHQAADPANLFAQWHRALATDGFVMFSCLGPDTLRELRALYARLGWPAPTHEFTDMHDLGDLLVTAGFAEPVMDMERITLTFGSPARLLVELRGLGRNLHVKRFAALRGRAWRTRLEAALDEHLRLPPEMPGGSPGPLALSFEVIYGHALKPAPRLQVAPRTEIALDDMKTALRQRRKS